MFLHDLLRFLPRKPWRRALDHLARGDFEVAAALFEALLDEHEQPSADLTQYACEAYLQAARRLRATGDVASAVLWLERVVALRPGFADVQFFLGQLYEETDRASEARLAFERALEVKPRYFEARLALVRLLTDHGESEAALRHLQVAGQTSPPALEFELTQLLARGSTASSRAHLDQLCADANDGGALAAALESARSALHGGETRTAIVALQQLLQKHQYADLHNLLGIAYDQEGLVDDAVEEFERALAINTEYAEARLNLGVALFHRGHVAEAERHLRRLERAHPEHSLVRDLLEQIGAQESR